MASQWYSLVSQKLFLAEQLLRLKDSAGAPADSEPAAALREEAKIQGAVELMLRARQLTLTMIARFHQVRQGQPANLEQLAALIGEESGDVVHLRELAQSPGNWWNHLDQLERSQCNPPAQRKTVSSDNIIAIAAETGPDRSTNALTRTLGEMKQFANDLEERNSEW
ncbi:hypothetical protein LPB19_14705 [Marinobacter salinisoli]|uniref:Uncharacterized protein n=1 Tax=Marinobacter salinisoli TaxID=2769486 RepID=A0ABX7MQ23_9GAMM|nr:DUF6586 family protein [Marinobacter salinisoli]QSP94416.1 hypothetical protein LPB19_14705 [Marinobacter salinisoli]